MGDFAKIDETTGAFETAFIWDILEKLDVHAVSPGPRELTLWKTFSELKARGTIPVVQANLTVKEKGKESPVGEAFRVFPVNGVRVGVFSLMGGGEVAGIRPPEGIEFGFQDPFQLAAALVPRIREKADVVVLMSQMGTADTDRLIGTVPGIDVALYGQRPVWEENARLRGATLVNQTGARGQYSGELVVIVDPDGRIVDYGSRNRELAKGVAEKDEILKAVNDTEAAAKKMREDLRKAREAEAQKKMTGERYLGGENCRTCHSREYEHWAASPHARAYASLSHPIPGKPFTAECVSCHSTGYDAGGFVPDASQPDFLPARADGPELSAVQCEACHGVGTHHTRTGKVEVAESVCRSCHTPEWSPGFDYRQALAAVRHTSRVE